MECNKNLNRLQQNINRERSDKATNKRQLCDVSQDGELPSPHY